MTHDVLLSAPGLGRARECAISQGHRPTPMRFVWHHVLPQTCGGQTAPNNLVALCDSCHYSVHTLLWHLAQSSPPPHRGTHKQRTLALAGYTAAVRAGTVALIPNEGG